MIEGVYLVLDPEATGHRSPVEVARRALAAGVSAIQWRQKGGSLAETWPAMVGVRTRCREMGAPFLVNDRADVAMALDADGVHVGQDDLPAAMARGLLPSRILGVSITDLSQIRAAESAGADYLGVGPIFPTASKPDAAPALGLDGLRSARALTALPIVAIGGISAQNVERVYAAGADAVAVISAICQAEDIDAAVHALRAGATAPRSRKELWLSR